MNKLINFILLFFTSFAAADSIDDFVEMTLGQRCEIIPKEAIDQEPDMIEDGMLARIYFVKNGYENIAVVKVFPKEIGAQRDYIRERKAYESLMFQQSANLNPPHLMAAGEDEEHTYLIMEMAKGKSLNKWLRAAGQSYLKRKQKILYALEAIEESSRYLRAFHERTRHLPLKQDPYSLKWANGRFEWLIDHCEKNTVQGIDLVTLKSLHQEMQKKITEQSLTLGQTHGDLHPGNVFYDPMEHRVTFIDFTRLSYPLQTYTGEPIARDAMQYLMTLQACAKGYGWTQEEIQLIEDAFFKGYGQDSIRPIELNYYKLIEAIEIIDTFDADAYDVKASSDLLKAQFEKMYAFSKAVVIDEINRYI
ncbi:MAG: aminoglycoside phosphotransferase family protein [Simkaniaceae bacterium]|nr:aminoglycoside phosphotransferase family protein [Simkaniaceae bacterium]